MRNVFTFGLAINTRETGHLGPVKMADVLDSTDVTASCLHSVSDVRLTLTSDTHVVKNVGTEQGTLFYLMATCWQTQCLKVDGST